MLGNSCCVGWLPLCIDKKKVTGLFCSLLPSDFFLPSKRKPLCPKCGGIFYEKMNKQVQVINNTNLLFRDINKFSCVYMVLNRGRKGQKIASEDEITE